MNPYEYVWAGCVLAISTTAMVTDWRTHKIPNWLTMPALLVAFAFHTATATFYSPTGGDFKSPAGMDGFVFSFLGFLVGFGILIIPAIIGGGTGGGDLKLLAAMGAWFGAFYAVVLFLAATVVALFLSMFVIIRKLVTGRSMKARKPADSDSDADADAEKEAKKKDSQKKKKKSKGGTVKAKFEKGGRVGTPFAIPICAATWICVAIRYLQLTGN